MNIHIEDERIIEVCKNSISMSQAASTLGIHYNTLKKHAERLGVFNPNQAGKGMSKPNSFGNVGFDLNDILEGKYPQYQTFKLKNRLLKEGIFENKCSECGVREWNKKPLNMELDHIDGNRTNHRLENLRMLCPNCHSQTDTYRSKNRI